MPQDLPFVTLDVFATERFKGNPLAVITIPHGTTPYPTQQQKQAIAREFNLSETVFVHEHGDPSRASQRDIDIFLTNAEIPFAGHPTIGTAVSLLAAGVSTLVTKAGPIPVAETKPGLVHAAIPHNVRLHAKRLRDISFPAGHGGLSADPVVRGAEAAAPVFSIVKGMTFVLIELPSLEHLAGVQRSQTQFPVATLLDEGFNTGFIARYYFVRLPPSAEDSSTGAVRIRSRMIESDFEDPATGSAACSLCSYLAAFEKTHDGEDRKVRYEITQGVEMGRDSHIVVEVGTKGGQVDSVSLGGTAVQVMRGTVPYV
ncbi:hypothetical protein N3K66_004830 [Trichothecium roseum]|uniref:Uncharacterized protein n=1 Tax=Trichothecium roseum TaxID=47278 RepID=A0ACC0V423_9HYPO|nr:hypothetical protein N3K66_004830 [Trichothecium roseum]